MKHAWDSYVTYAWGHDELDPIAKTGKDGFGGLGATVCHASMACLVAGVARCPVPDLATAG